MAATIKVPTIFTAEDKFSSVVRRMTGGVTKFSRNTGAAVQRLDHKITRSFKKIGRFAQLGLGIGLAGIFSMAVRSNIEYEDSLASVSAITGAVGDDLIKLENISTATAKATKKSGSEVLKAYELIASAKPELLANIDALDGVTRSAILLSKASRMDLESSALSLTDVMNQFNISATGSAKVIDVLAAGAKYGAAAIPLIKDAILGFGVTASAANINLKESVALVETFATKGVKGAEAGTKLRNVLTKMSAVNALPPEALKQLDKFGVNTDLISNKQLPLIDRLKELSKISGDATALVKVFGLENKDAAQILLQNLPVYEDLVGKMGESGIAAKQAATNTNTFRFALDAIKTAFTNTTTATQNNNTSLEITKNLMFWVGNNMDILIGSVVSLLGAYALLKAITWGVQLATFAYNVAMGISAVRAGAMSIAMKGNAVAIGAYNIATNIAAASQWVLNVAMSANPIGLVVAGIIALIAVVYIIIKKYDEWGASLALLLGPLGWIINLIQSFRRHWDSIKEAFATDGIVGGLKRIGAVILDSLLMPMQQFLGMIAKIPGVGKMVAPALKFIEDIRANLDLDNNDPVATPDKAIIPSPEERNWKIIQENLTKGKIDLNLNDPGKMVKDVNTSGNVDIPIKVGSTQGQR